MPTEFSPSDLTRTVRTKITVDETSGCWLWTGAVDNHGYAAMKLAGKRQKVHRFVYTRLVGEIPEDLELDHLCTGHRNCVNPAHLEPVESAENARRANFRRHHEGYRRNPYRTSDTTTNPDPEEES